MRPYLKFKKITLHILKYIEFWCHLQLNILVGKDSKDICLVEKTTMFEIAQIILPIVKHNLQFTLNELLNTTDIKFYELHVMC